MLGANNEQNPFIGILRSVLQLLLCLNPYFKNFKKSLKLCFKNLKIHKIKRYFDNKLKELKKVLLINRIVRQWTMNRVLLSASRRVSLSSSVMSNFMNGFVIELTDFEWINSYFETNLTEFEWKFGVLSRLK